MERIAKLSVEFGQETGRVSDVTCSKVGRPLIVHCKKFDALSYVKFLTHICFLPESLKIAFVGQ